MAAYAHDLAASIVTFAGAPIPASGEDEFLSFDLPPEFFTTTSNDGSRVRSMNPDRANGKVTITTFRGSVAHKRLADKYALQKAGTVRATTATFPDGPFSWVDASTGDTIVAESAAIEQAPAPGVSAQASTVQWVLDLQGVTRKYATAVIDFPA